jgi:hypothetical protein
MAETEQDPGDLCGLALCSHRRDGHRQDADQWAPLGRECLVEGCPCARFVEPQVDDRRLRTEIEAIVERHGYSGAVRRSHTWWVNRLKLALMETARPDGCRCRLVKVGDTPSGWEWSPDCPVHPWDDALQAATDRAVEMQRLAREARRQARDKPST